MAGLGGFLYLAASFYRRHIGTPGSVLFAVVKVSFFSFSVNVLKIIIIRNADCPPCWYYKFVISVDFEFNGRYWMRDPVLYRSMVMPFARNRVKTPTQTKQI